MAEEKKPVTTITLKVTIPIREIASFVRQVFPFIEVSIEEEKKPEEAPPVKPEG